jgi:CrcB protein
VEPGVIHKIGWVGVGGFLGANARYWVGAWVQARLGEAFPWATFAINVSGSLLLGLLLGLLAGRGDAQAAALRLSVAAGFLGAYTTFSTFEHETLTLLEGGAAARALVYLAGSVVLGLAAAWVGLRLGEWLAR